jgi:hypothetical protein
MSKERFLLIAVVFLLVLNGGVIAYLIFGRSGPPKPPQLFELIINRLHLDENQQEKFFALRDEHRSTMDSLDAAFEKTVRNYLGLLSSDHLAVNVQDSLENVLAAIEKRKASHTLIHFQQVKELCNVEQKREFEKLLPELTRILLPPKKNLPPRRQ